MTAMSINAQTGEIIGTMFFMTADFHIAISNVDYTGSSTGAYFGPLDQVDGLASVMNGMTVSEFRNLPSGIRDSIRSAVRNAFGVGGGNRGVQSFRDFISTVNFANNMFNQQHQNDGQGLTVGIFDADLIVGLIPEMSNVNISQSKKDAIQKWANRAIDKMRNWSAQTTVEFAKAIRREHKHRRDIEQVFRLMVEYRDAGKTKEDTIRKIMR